MRRPMSLHRATRLCAAILVFSLSSSCSSGPSDPAALRLIATTAGPSADPDGYTYSLDGNPTAPLGPNETVTLTGLNPGVHDLVLGGVASNCTLSGGLTRSVALSEGDTTEIPLTVNCQASGPTIIATV